MLKNFLKGMGRSSALPRTEDQSALYQSLFEYLISCISVPANAQQLIQLGYKASKKDAEEIGNPQARWANARAEAGADISDQATEELMSWSVGKVVGMAGVVVFGHGARHLLGTILEREAVEAAIEKDIQMSVKDAAQTGSFWGRVNVNGKVVEYRAFTLPDGKINVGTYYTPKP